MTTKKSNAKTTKKTAAKPAAKPELTSARVNSRIRSLLGKKGDKGGDQLSKDWRAFIASEFSLSKTQAANLKNIPAEEVAKVQGGFRDAVKQGGEFRLKLGSEAGSGAGELTIQPKGPTTPSRTIKITIIKCTFDANCRNWHCKLGPLTI